MISFISRRNNIIYESEPVLKKKNSCFKNDHHLANVCNYAKKRRYICRSTIC